MIYKEPNWTPLSPALTDNLPAPTSNPQSVSAKSIGGGGFGNVPNLSLEQSQTLAGLLSGLTYSVPAGGYLFNDAAQNANSWWTKFGANSGGDPAANAVAAKAYGIIGSAPTTPLGTPALAKLQGNSFPGRGLQPVAGPAGPSLTSQLGETYQGPYEFGKRTRF